MVCAPIGGNWSDRLIQVCILLGLANADMEAYGLAKYLEGGVEMSSDQSETDLLDEMGPIDYFVIEFPGRRTSGEGLPLFVDLVDRGIIRVLDLAFVRKEVDGTVYTVDLADLGPELAVFEGASSGLLGQEDFNNAAEAIATDSTAALLVYENRWAAPIATALRRGGAQLVSNGRIPVQAMLAALEEVATPN